MPRFSPLIQSQTDRGDRSDEGHGERRENQALRGGKGNRDSQSRQRQSQRRHQRDGLHVCRATISDRRPTHRSTGGGGSSSRRCARALLILPRRPPATRLALRHALALHLRANILHHRRTDRSSRVSAPPTPVSGHAAKKRTKMTPEQREKLIAHERERKRALEVRVRMLTNKLVERLRPFVEAKNPGAPGDTETVA